MVSNVPSESLSDEAIAAAVASLLGSESPYR